MKHVIDKWFIRPYPLLYKDQVKWFIFHACQLEASNVDPFYDKLECGLCREKVPQEVQDIALLYNTIKRTI